MDKSKCTLEKICVSPKVDMELDVKNGDEIISKKKLSCDCNIPLSVIAAGGAAIILAIHGIAFICQKKKEDSAFPKSFLKKGEQMKCRLMKKAKKLF